VTKKSRPQASIEKYCIVRYRDARTTRWHLAIHRQIADLSRGMSCGFDSTQLGTKERL
jgi:hypothetical protein